MEEVYKNSKGFWGMSSGLKYTKDEVKEVNGSYWKESRGGPFPQYPAQGDSVDSVDLQRGKGVVKGKKGL